MRGRRARPLPVLLLLIAGSTLPNAAPALDLGFALPSSLRLAAGSDDDGGYDYFLNLDQALPGGQRALFTFGRSRSVGVDGNVEPTTVALGVSSDPLDQLMVAADVEDWGQDGEITTRSVRGNAQWRSNRWQLGLGVHMRSIEIFLQPPLTILGQNSVEITSEGAEFGIGLQLAEPLFVQLTYFDNNYSRDLGFLDDPIVVRDFIVFDPTSSVTFSLAAGLQEQGGGLTASLLTDWGGVNGDWSRSVSAVDGAASTVLSLGLDFDLSAATVLQLTGGRQSTPGQDDLLFGSAALLITW